MYRDLKFESAIDFAHDLVRIPSLSGDEGAVAERVVSECKLLRFDDVWSDGIGNVLARVKGRGRAPAIMLSSHLDVVDAGDPAEWEFPPYSGNIEGGYLHGRGAMDCKGPLAIQTYAAASLLESRPEGDVYLAHTVLEERGSWGMAHVMENQARRPAALVLGEATSGDICVGHRGRRELTITIRGKSAHASAPQGACSPVDQLPAVLAALKKFVDQLPSHAVLPRATLVPSMIETWPNSRNMVPEEVRIVIDWRALPDGGEQNSISGLLTFLQDQVREDWADRSAELKLVVQEVHASQRAYTGLEYTRPISTPGFLLEESHPVVQAAVQAVHESTGRMPAVRAWTFGTDGGYACGAYGVPTIGYGPGNENNAHTNRERLHLDSALAVYQAYPALLRQLQRALAGEVPVTAPADDEDDHQEHHLFVRRLRKI
jgi:putative selenium metabolism hydrolase